jgi:predicted nucleic acid-binding protein
MNILIDTNVVLDILLRRKPHYANAVRIIVLSEKGYLNSYVSASAVTDIFYIAKKELKDNSRVLNLLNELLKTVRIASVTESIIFEALDLNWKDFEDSVQYVTGKVVSAEYIITRNPSDFAESQMKVVSPEEFVNRITQ